jgi:hypothetical protein
VDGALVNEREAGRPENLQAYNVYIAGSWFGVHGPMWVDEIRISNKARRPDELLGCAPQIAVQPQSVTAVVGTTARFAVMATGAVPLAWQWRVNGIAIPGATNATLLLPNVQTHQSGNRYSVVVTNALGRATSVEAALMVLTLPATIAEAVDAPHLSFVLGGDAPWFMQTNVTHDGADAAQSGNLAADQESWMETTLVGPGTLTFWWRASSEEDFDLMVFFLNVTPQAEISGETDWEGVEIQVPPGQHALRWTYTKDETLSEGWDAGWVDQVGFTAAQPPLITLHPSSQTVLSGATVALRVEVSGAQPMSYQWFHNGTPLAGGTNALLTISNVQPTDAGRYQVVVSNTVGLATSDEAALTVTGMDPAWQWARGGGGGGCDFGWNIALDTAGNVFVIGEFNHYAYFGDFRIHAENYYGFFVARYNTVGELLWVRQAEGNAEFFGSSDAVTDPAGNLWVAGQFEGTATLGTFTLQSTSDYDLFFAKFAPDGQVLWVLHGPATDPDSTPILAADSAGGVVVAAPFNARGDLGGHPLTNADHGVFVAQFDNTGRVAWVQTATPIATSFRGFDLALDPNGNVFFAGAVWPEATFGNLRFTNSTDTSLVLVKCDPAGHPLWARQVGDAGLQMAYEGLDLAVGPGGQAYVLGGFCGTGSMGGFQLTSRGWGDDFVVKFSGAGEVLWANQAGGSHWDTPRQLVVDAADQCSLLGDLFAPWEVSSTDGCWLTNADTGYGIATFDPMGRARWTRTLFGSTIAVAPGGGLYVMGNNQGLRVTRLGFEGQALWTVQGGGSDDDYGDDWAVDQQGNIHVAGRFSGIVSYGGDRLASQGGFDIFVGKLNAGLPPLLSPVITQSPVSQTRYVGQAATFTVEATGTPPLSYQWQFNGADISGATNALLTVGNLGPEQAGDYWVIVSNCAGSVTGGVARLTVTSAAPFWAWAQAAGGTLADSGNGIATDSEGNVYVTGSFQGNAQIGPYALSTFGQTFGLFLAKYDRSGNLLWVVHQGVPEGDHWLKGHRVATDAAGFVYLLGEFRGDLDIAGTRLRNYGNSMFLAKYDRDGRALWALQAQRVPWRPNESYRGDLAVDASGHVYLTGSFDYTLTLGDLQFWGHGWNDADGFIAKIAPTGRVLWVREISGANNQAGTSVACDADGQVCVAGEAGGSTTFQGQPIFDTGLEGVFVLKLTGAGDLLWSQHASGSGGLARGCATDLAGNIYLAGIFGELTFGDIVLSTSGGNATFVAKYDTLGRLLWAVPAAEFPPNPGNQVMAESLAVDGAGHAWLAGSFSGEVTLGPSVLTSTTGASDVFVAKLDRSGHTLWGAQAGGEGCDQAHALALDAAGNGWIAGQFMQPAAFGTNGLAALGDTDVFVARLGSGIRAPTMLAQPQSLTTNLGTTVMFIAPAAGEPPLSYQWIKDGAWLSDANDLSGATTPRLVLRNVQSGDAGGYCVVASNALGVVTSAVARLTVDLQAIAPVILMQPVGRAALRGDLVTFFVVAPGSEPLSCQWQWNGADLPGATNVTLALANVQADQAGDYAVVVRNAAGTVLSSNAVLTVEWTISLGEAVDAVELDWRTSGDRPWIGQSEVTHDGSDAAQSFRTYDCDESWLETTVEGPGVIAFVWMVNTAPGNAYGFLTNGVSVAQTSGVWDWQRRSFILPPGRHRLRWSHSGCHTSYDDQGWLDEVRFTPGPPTLPTLTLQPRSQTVPVGAGAWFAIEANGPEPLVYQWRLDGADLPGATNSLLVLRHVQTRHAGAYTVCVSNPVGSVTSAIAVLTVTTPACAALPEGLVNWWPGDGDRQDLVGGANAAGSGTFGPGKVGSAFSFGGPDDRVRAPGGNLRVGTGDFSVEGWAWSGSGKWWNTLVSFDRYHPALYLLGDGTLQLWPAEPSAASGFNDGQWHHFAVVRLAGFLTYFQDGQPAGTATYDAALDPEEILIGSDDSPDDYFYGFIDEVACYRRALSPAEVHAIYAADSVGKCREPQAPVFLVSPTDQTVPVGQDATFRTVVTGYPAPSLQWRRLRQDLPGETNATLVIREVQPVQAGTPYAVVARNALGAATSDTAVLWVSSVLSLTEALDDLNLSWATSGDLAPWFPQTETALDGEAAAQSGRIGPLQASCLETTVTGPGRLEFWWRVSSEEAFDVLRFTVSDIEQAAISGETSWERVTVEIADGRQVLRWSYAKDETVSAGCDCGWVDQVQFTSAQAPNILLDPYCQAVAPGTPVTFRVVASGYPVPTSQWFFNGQAIHDATNASFKLDFASLADTGEYMVVVRNALGVATSRPAWLAVRSDFALAEAVDAFDMVWRTGGTDWLRQFSVTHDGSDAARSASIWEDNQSWLETTVTGPGLVSFWWKVSSLWFSDRLIFSIGGQVITNISGEVDWQEETFAVPPGPQTLRWTYAVADNGSAGSNCGWLDQVRFVPNAVPVAPVIALQPQSQTVEEGGDVLFTVGVGGTRPFTFQWQQDAVVLVGRTNDFLALAEVMPSHAGRYSVIASNLSGAATSQPATLTVRPPLAEWQWARCAEDNFWCAGHAVATDPDGHVYVTGTYNGAMRLGQVVVANESGRWEFFMVKYDAAGNALWERHSAGPSSGPPHYTSGLGLATDAAGNVVAIGDCSTDIRIGDVTFSGGGVFIVKHDRDGNQLWARHIAGPGSANASHVATDGGGNVFLLGRYTDSITVDPYTLTTTNNSDVYLAKLNPVGEALWLVSVGGWWCDSCDSLAVDGTGHPYVAFYTPEEFTLGTNEFASGLVVAKFAPDGQVLWALQPFPNRWGYCSVAVDTAGHLFVSGTFSGTVALGTNVLTSSHANAMFLAKYDSAGQLLWARQGGGFRWIHPGRVAVDAAGNAYVMGDFSGVVTFGPHALVASGEGDFFVLKYDPTGREVWAKKGVAESAGPGNAMAVDRAGHVYVAGVFNSQARFGPHVLQPASSPNVYLAKLGEVEPLRFDTSSASLHVTNGVFCLQLLGLRGRSPIVIEASTNLVNWEAVFTNAAPVEPVEFCEPIGSGQPARFFRARLIE